MGPAVDCEPARRLTPVFDSLYVSGRPSQTEQQLAAPVPSVVSTARPSIHARLHSHSYGRRPVGRPLSGRSPHPGPAHHLGPSGRPCRTRDQGLPPDRVSACSGAPLPGSLGRLRSVGTLGRGARAVRVWYQPNRHRRRVGGARASPRRRSCHARPARVRRLRRCEPRLRYIRLSPGAKPQAGNRHASVERRVLALGSCVGVPAVGRPRIVRHLDDLCRPRACRQRSSPSERSTRSSTTRCWWRSTGRSREPRGTHDLSGRSVWLRLARLAERGRSERAATRLHPPLLRRKTIGHPPKFRGHFTNHTSA